MYAQRPCLTSRSSRRAASVDFPDAGRPVIHTVAPTAPKARQRCSRVSLLSYQVTLGLQPSTVLDMKIPLPKRPTGSTTPLILAILAASLAVGCSGKGDDAGKTRALE